MSSAAAELDDAFDCDAPPIREGVWSTSFTALLVTQFCTALNDHTFRWLVVPIAKPLLGDAESLSLGLMAFTLPFLVLSLPAGFLADRFSKGRVISQCKLAEIGVLAFGLATILWANPTLLFITIAATGALAALFSPAKLGAIPELVGEYQLTTANGWMGMMTVLPCALGFLLGNVLAGFVQPKPEVAITVGRLLPAAAVIMVIAIIGWGASLKIQRLPAADPQRVWNWNLIKETTHSVSILWATPALLRTSLGISFFWMLASLAQINIDTFGIDDLGLSQRDIGILGMVLVIGVGLGSVLTGKWSGGRIELAYVAAGALGIIVCSATLWFTGRWGHAAPQWAFWGSCVALLGLGVSAGLFDVPLEAYLQHRSPPEQRGGILAATNFLMFTGVLFVALLFYVLHKRLGVSASGIFLLSAVMTIPVAIYIVVLLPASSIRLLFLLFANVCYRLQVYGRHRIPLEGGCVLAPNHVTWVDGILLQVAAPRPVRFIAFADFVNHPRLRWLARVFEVIPIKADAGPKALLQSIKVAREALQQGACICIFAEGTLTRTGQIQPFQPGILKIIQGTNAPVIPTCLHGLWGSIFSYRDGKFFYKWPRQLPYPTSVLFGKPILNPSSVDEIRQVVHELGAAAVELDKPYERNAPRQMIRACRRGWNRSKCADSTGQDLTGGRVLIGALALRKALLKHVLKSDETNVGIYLPSTVAGVLANLAVTLTGRVSVNLNYTLSTKDLRFCAQDAGLKHVITSRKFLEKKPIELDAELIFLEDLKEKIGGLDKVLAACAARIVPAALLERWLGLTRISPDDPITIIYTSGSTGEPKGVVLTHHNIAATVDAADQVFQVDKDDVVLGVLPIFHCFGYLTTLWLPMITDAKVAFHPNPLDARQIGELAEQHKATILFATPTFLRSYLKRCTKEQFAKLDLVVVGAEKLPGDLAEHFREKFGVLPQEGYGTTETSGPAAVNVPDHRCSMVHQRGTKLGTVGRPLPGVVARIINPDTNEIMPVNAEGLVYIKGPNIMQGYFHLPEKTASVLKDGWYNTGDMGKLDEEGFLHITGRVSRFSKIGGEMVPHIKVEEELLRVLESATTEDQGPLLAVTAVPDEKKGERLIVLHRPLQKPIPQVLQELSQAGLPNLWLPGADGFIEVAQIPLLGTGKLDLKGVKQLALERTGT